MGVAEKEITMRRRQVVIAGACRTPIGKFGGSLAGVRPADLGAAVIREAISRADIEGEEIEEVIMGCVLTAGQGMNIARQAALAAGLPESVCAYTVNKVCGSGLKAVVLAAQSIALEDSTIVLAGGVENMSQAPYLTRDCRWGTRLGHGEHTDSLLRDGLWDAFHNCHMGETAENIAVEFSISRLEQDQFAVESQRKCAEAVRAGKFSREIVPVQAEKEEDKLVLVRHDECPRPGTTAEILSKLKPAFKKEGGTVTAGNSSGIGDGGAAVVLMSEETAQKRGIPILGRIVSSACVGVSPLRMGLGPVPAVKEALKKADLSMTDIDLFEVNEAFAAQTIAVRRSLGIPSERLNIYGGAISLGHPIGASGARIVVTLLAAMADRGAHRGLCALCIGGGMGMAMIVERQG